MRCHTRVHTICFALLAAALGACAPKGPPVVIVKGDCADLFRSPVCTWAHMQGGHVLEAGATVPIAAIENAPQDAPMTWPPVVDAIARIPDSAQSGSGFTHMTVYWEATGHPPGAYMTPHFDFHFYLVPPTELASVDCKNLTKPRTLPAAYALPDIPLPPPVAKMFGVDTLVGLCVPQMGMHAALAAQLAATSTVSGTMIIGYYGGKPIFIEPMLARAMLLQRKSFDLAMPAIPGMTGMYPRKFHAEYDAQEEVFRFVFSDFAAGA